MPLFSFPDDARWNPDNESTEFSVAVGEYERTVRVSGLIFRRLSGHSVSPEQYIEAYHLHRVRFERAVEAKIHRRELSEDANIDLTGRDLQHRAVAHRGNPPRRAA
jgi:hypothetical protein